MTPYAAKNSETSTQASSDVLRSPVIAQPGDGTPVRAFGNEILFKLTSEQTGGAFNVGLATVPAGNAVPPHVQDREDEMFIIVEGAYRFWVDGAEIDAAPG